MWGRVGTLSPTSVQSSVGAPSGWEGSLRSARVFNASVLSM